MTATDDYTAVHRIMGVVFGETQAPWSAPFDTADGRRRSGELLGHRERCLPRCRYQVSLPARLGAPNRKSSRRLRKSVHGKVKVTVKEAKGEWRRHRGELTPSSLSSLAIGLR